MALFTAASFPGATAEQPSAGGTATPSLTTAINFSKSDGTTAVVFDSLRTALNCLSFMNSRKQYYLMANDDIMIINVSGVKLFTLETTFINQKLMNSFAFIYVRGGVVCVHRNLSTIMTVSDALVSVGYKKSDTTPFDTNYDLDGAFSATPSNRPFIQVVDVNYVTPSTQPVGSHIKDSTGIVYGQTPSAFA